MRHYIGTQCSNYACIVYHPLDIEGFEKTIANLILCPLCREKLDLLDPYRIEEIDRLFNWVKISALTDYAIQDLITFSKPSLPVLETQITRQTAKEHSGLFTPYGILLILHFLDDLIPFIDALKSLGAPVESICLLVKPYPYGNRSGVGGCLAYHYKNLRTIYLPSLPPAEAHMKQAVEFALHRSQTKKILVIEDGGYIVPFIHKKYPNYSDFCIGAVEQTTKGIRGDERLIDLKIPVIDVAKSKFKDRVEAPLVGKSIIYNLQRILEPLGIHLQGKKAAVVGYGAIGKEVAQSLRDLGMHVHVADLDLSALCEAGIRGYKIEKRTEDLVKGAALIIGTTGGTRKGDELVHTISGDVLRNLSDGAILVSASSDQIEIDLAELKSMAKTTRLQGLGTWYAIKRAGGEHRHLVIGDGYPINFFRGQGIPNQSIDPILTQLLLGAVHLATIKSGEQGIIEGIADKLLEENHVIEDLLYAHNLLG